MATTPAARQVVIDAPSTMTLGRRSTVKVTLTASGDETLNRVRLALQLPQGWTQRSVGPASFAHVSPSASVSATFSVTPPSWAPAANDVIHATAALSRDAIREAGVTVTVGS